MLCPLPPPPLCSGGFLLIKPIQIKFSFIKSEFGYLTWPQSRSPGHEDFRAPGSLLVSLSTSCFQISHTPRPGFILTHAHFISPFSSSCCSTERECASLSQLRGRKHKSLNRKMAHLISQPPLSAYMFLKERYLG